jgi:CheY-like chemotaxis protein
MKILVAEDDPISRVVLEENVEALGHECLAAEDGAEAWELYEKTPDIEVIVSDWMMPNMDGVELCRRVRGLERDRYIFFIILTALRGRERLLEGLRAGADEYLTKPLDGEQLQARLEVASRVTALHRHVRPKNGGEERAPGPSYAGEKPGVEGAGSWEFLVSEGKLDEEQLQRALEIQRSDPREFGEILVSEGIISGAHLAKARAHRLGLLYLDLDVRDIDTRVVDLVPEDVLRRLKAVPLRAENDRLFVAVGDPNDLRALEELGELSGFSVVPVVTTEEAIRRAQTRLFGIGQRIRGMSEKS